MVVKRRRYMNVSGTNVIVKRGSVETMRQLSCSCGGNFTEMRDPATQEHVYKCRTCGTGAISQSMD
jgi:hypothetical protein